MSQLKDSFLTGSNSNIEQKFGLTFNYEVAFTFDTFNPNSTVLKDLLGSSEAQPKILPVIDANVLYCFPDLEQQIINYSNHHDFNVMQTLSVPGGEQCKNDPCYWQAVVEKVYEHRIDRHSYILAIGGGAVLDMIGYAASISHRGIRLIRMPTTVLAQNDAGIGIKNAVNFKGRKNFIGTFAPPFGVINDFQFLQSLKPRDLRSGIAETIKVALLKDPALFHYLAKHTEAVSQFQSAIMETIIKEGARLHLDHIRTSGDPFEKGSARPLDFGHWSAHKLEEISNYELRHGEAVAMGITLDCLYANKVGLLNDDNLSTIIEFMKTVGFPLDKSSLSKLAPHQALEEFKEHLGGELTITLINEIGQAQEVNEICSKTMTASLEEMLNFNGWASL